MKLIGIKNGFTLIELLTVMAVVGILALIGIPAFRAYEPSLQLSGAVKEIATDLRYAEQLAITEQVDHGVVFFPGSNKYQVIRRNGSDEIIKTQILPQEVTFQGISGLTNNEAIFNPYGAAKESGIVTLINTKNATTAIDIRPSGFIKIIK